MPGVIERGAYSGRVHIRIDREEVSERVRRVGLTRDDCALLSEWCLLGEVGDTLYFHDNAVTRELFGVE
jgi:hypothetical protein